MLMVQSLMIDYIIVGQGLAGSAVAAQLIMKKKSILVIDQYSRNSSSRVAAGLFNPITGRKMVKSWLADELFPCLHRFYTQVEEITKTKFFYPMPIYRPFVSVAEQNEWMARSTDPAIVDYIVEIHTQSLKPANIHDPWGGIVLKQSGYLNTTVYLKAVEDWIGTNFYLHEQFEAASLRIFEDKVEYKGWTANAVIFCEGERVNTNDWFRWLPVSPVKGETLTIQGEYYSDLIINRGIYIVPSGGNEFCIGSTYNWEDLRRSATPEGRSELQEKLETLIAFPYEITGHSWGMRPAMPDRRPVLGPHPENEKLVVFNGLGTKGVSLSPYFSDILVRWLENNEPINKDVNISRYKSLY